MGLAIFPYHRDHPGDVNPAEAYRFPVRFLPQVEACIGDWIVYCEPAGLGTTAEFFAIAKVARIEPEPASSDSRVAALEPGSYLDFAIGVPVSMASESDVDALRASAGPGPGISDGAIRPLSPTAFGRIVRRGLDQERGSGGQDDILRGFHEDIAPFPFEQHRDRMNYVVSRIVRDRVFRRIVLRAYDQRCAVTGLKLIDGSGRAEVAAAHIRPVSENGPDIVSNGIALSGTAHWMFDRGLISLSDDLEILISPQAHDPESVRAFISPSGRAQATLKAQERPHPHFLRWHRENCFKL